MKYTSFACAFGLFLVSWQTDAFSRPSLLHVQRGNERIVSQTADPSNHVVVSRRQNQLTKTYMLDPSALIPTIIFIGAVAASIVTEKDTVPAYIRDLLPSRTNSDKDTGDDDDISVLLMDPPTPTPAPASVAEVENPNAEPVVLEKVMEVLVPEPTPEPVSKAEPEVVVIEETTKSKTSQPRSTTELIKEIASTVEEQRETQERIASRQAAKAAAEEAKKVEKATEELVDIQEEIEESTRDVDSSSSDLPQRGKKRKLAMRVIKKVIAPWRKWKNIK